MDIELPAIRREAAAVSPGRDATNADSRERVAPPPAHIPTRPPRPCPQGDSMNPRFAMLGVVALLAVALLAAACGGGSGSGIYGSQKPAASAGTQSANATQSAATVGVGSTKLGSVVVDS